MGMIRIITRGFLKPCVDVKSWIGWSSMKTNTLGLIDLFKPLFRFSIKKSTRQETFEHAMQRLQLTEADLTRKVQILRNWLVIYSTVIFICVCYAAILFFHTHWFAGLVTIVLLSLFVVKAWEARFWQFQIKHRKLGCTFKEWRQGRIEEHDA